MTSVDVYMDVNIAPHPPTHPTQEEISNVEEQTQVKASSVGYDKCGGVHGNMNHAETRRKRHGQLGAVVQLQQQVQLQLQLHYTTIP